MTTIRPISEDDLHAYVDHKLDSRRHAEVEAYLVGHPDMAQRVEDFARQRAMLRAALDPLVQEPLPARFNLSRMIEARRKPSATVWRLVAPAALLLVAGGASGWFGHAAMQAPRGGVAALAQEASDNYAVFTPDLLHPVELRAGDGADLANWVSKRLQHSVRVPNLASSGFRFMGGRLVATPHGPAGMFMYDDDKKSRLVMLMRAMAVEKDAPMSHYEKGAMTGLSWAQGGMGYSLVGEASLARLQPIANDIRKQVAPGG
jgi:anti-sigma factor RsiW